MFTSNKITRIKKLNLLGEFFTYFKPKNIVKMIASKTAQYTYFYLIIEVTKLINATILIKFIFLTKQLTSI